MIYPLLQPTVNAPESAFQWALIGLAVVMIIFTIFRPSLRRKDPLAKGPPASLSQQRAVEREMQNLLVELSEMARQISAQLDTRAAKLELLIREADEKIAQMKSLQAIGREPDSSTRAAPPPTADAPPSARIDPRHAQVYDLSDRGHNVAQIAQQLDRPSGEIELILALRPKKVEQD